MGEFFSVVGWRISFFGQYIYCPKRAEKGALHGNDFCKTSDDKVLRHVSAWFLSTGEDSIYTILSRTLATPRGTPQVLKI
jgi:hypothetical protein